MSRLPPSRPIFRCCLCHPGPSKSNSPTPRYFSISTRNSHVKNPLLLTEQRKSDSVFPSSRLLPCTTKRHYQNKHLPKKSKLVRMSSDKERNDFLARQAQKSAQWNARATKLKEMDEVQRDHNKSQALLEDLKDQDDMGLLMGTPVVIDKPWWPSPWQEPKRRLKMEYTLAKRLAFDRVSISLARLRLGFINFFRSRFSRQEAKQAAVALHHQMNQAIADGKLELLRTYTLSELAKDIRKHVAQRPPGTTYIWQRTGVQADLISHRISGIPMSMMHGNIDKLYLRQAVVRIRSHQALIERRFEDAEGLVAVVEAGEVDSERRKGADKVEQAGEFDELFVIQKRVTDQGDGPWKVWGLTQETTEGEWKNVEDPEGALERAEGNPAPRS